MTLGDWGDKSIWHALAVLALLLGLLIGFWYGLGIIIGMTIETIRWML